MYELKEYTIMINFYFELKGIDYDASAKVKVFINTTASFDGSIFHISESIRPLW